MSKSIFKVMGALIFLALIVSIGVGGVSADATILYSGTTTIVENSLIPSLTPVNYANPQPYLPAASDYGLIFTTLLTKPFESAISGDSYDGWIIDSINNIENDWDITGKNWQVYLNDEWVWYLSGLTVQDGDVLTVCYMIDGSEMTVSEALTDADYAVVITANVLENPVSIYSGSVTLSDIDTFDIVIGDQSSTPVSFTGVSNNSALNALIVGSGNNQNYMYNLSVGYDTSQGQPQPYAWLTDINGISPKWEDTGYGYVITIERGNSIIIPTVSLESIELQDNDKLVIYITASSSGGLVSSIYPTPVGIIDDPTSLWATTYYLGCATEMFTLDVTVA